jgi:signal transduction histidine kinase
MKLNITRKRLLVIGFGILGLAVIVGSWIVWRQKGAVVPSHTYELQSANMGEWKAIGGKWRAADGTIYNDSDERGAKLVTGSNAWRNYTLSADMRFKGSDADMGLIVRTANEMEGVDAYDGYYVGLRTLDGTMIIGRSHFGWAESQPVAVPGGVHSSVWYRLRVTAVGCNVAASVQNLTTLQTAWIAFYERSCLESGRVGLRSLNAGSMWTNISVAPATWNDYLDLQRHAASVEQLDFPPSRPWWTPWHAGILFSCVLAFALLTQLLFFRIQRWKDGLIVQEQERLAHEIHDTMAQSFAGIGYQIQGIRRGVVRADSLDASHIAEQLNVAYQLVRNCHEEASRTIAMLSSFSPLVQQHLLSSLAETAHKLAGDDIQVVTRLNGNLSPLSLRLTDALLHIGREAIANAARHANPTILTIVLSYDPNGVELSVEDNGRGFSYTQETAGFGILGMQKRAGVVSGTLQIISSPEAGTKIVIRARDDQHKFRDRLRQGLKEIFRRNSSDLNRR